ncbi:MAG: hypothetical protein IH624_08365 [Phycisphaerae bacterium]|nr:hypothetical protein [Phycisphaerae bacterium]
MLSFMKDGQNESKQSGMQAAGDARSGESPAAGGDQEFLTTAHHGKNLKHSTITLAILFTVGALCVWFMIKKTTPSAASAASSAEEAKLESAIAQLTGIKTEMDTHMGEIVERFYEFSEIDQIGVGELKKNPFAHQLSIGDLSNMDPGHELMAREEVNRKSRGLELWSIMASEKNGCCMINDKVLYVGDSINGFTVTQITPRFVELKCDGIGVILKMSE